MSASQDAETVLRRFLTEVWNAHRLDRFGEMVARDVVFHPPRGPPRGFDGYVLMAGEFLAAFPDLHFEIRQIVAHGERAAARLIITGTNDGPFRGRPATGRKVRVVGQPQCRVSGGRVVELWQLFDELGMLHQLGLVPDAGLVGHAAPAEE